MSVCSVCHMINFHVREKMLEKLLIFSLCFVAINAAGQFQVLSNPKGLAFKGQQALRSEYIADVFNVALGSDAKANADWSGMYVKDPFNLPSNGIAVLIEGISEISIDGDVHSFTLEGSRSVDSIEELRMDLEGDKYTVCDIDQESQPLDTYNACFGDALKESPTPTAPKLNEPVHKKFLEMIGVIHSITDHLDAINTPNNFLILRINVEPILSASGPTSAALKEARALLSSALRELNTAAEKMYEKGVFVAVIASEKTSTRSKREIIQPGTTDSNPYNLAEYYNQDYPVIFNIILWFMVVFGLSLLAICYAISAMDPGRDSIIYRMTSTRMKKDN